MAQITPNLNHKAPPVFATAKYEVENLDGGKEIRTGRELMEVGLAVTINQQPAALVFAYKRVK